MGRSKPVPIETSVLLFLFNSTLSSKCIHVPEIFPKGFFLVLSRVRLSKLCCNPDEIINILYIRTVNYVTCNEQ